LACWFPGVKPLFFSAFSQCPLIYLDSGATRAISLRSNSGYSVLHREMKAQVLKKLSFIYQLFIVAKGIFARGADFEIQTNTLGL
jgi:hypothetical protein